MIANERVDTNMRVFNKKSIVSLFSALGLKEQITNSDNIEASTN